MAKKPPGRFRMEAHAGNRNGRKPDDPLWQRMEGAAGHVWRARATNVEAIAKCMAWTGFAYIPAMQVIDDHTGQVIWRGVSDLDQARGLEPISHPMEDVARRLAQDTLRDCGDDGDGTMPTVSAQGVQEGLF